MVELEPLEAIKERLDEIKARVLESRLELEIQSLAGKDEFIAFANSHLEVLTEAINEFQVLLDELGSKAEQISGYGKTTMSKQGDPYFNLEAENVPYAIQLQQEKEELEALLISLATNNGE
jgi:hypothetical protein